MRSVVVYDARIITRDLEQASRVRRRRELHSGESHVQPWLRPAPGGADPAGHAKAADLLLPYIIDGGRDVAFELIGKQIGQPPDGRYVAAYIQAIARPRIPRDIQNVYPLAPQHGVTHPTRRTDLIRRFGQDRRWQVQACQKQDIRRRTGPGEVLFDGFQQGDPIRAPHDRVNGYGPSVFQHAPRVLSIAVVRVVYDEIKPERERPGWPQARRAERLHLVGERPRRLDPHEAQVTQCVRAARVFERSPEHLPAPVEFH